MMNTNQASTYKVKTSKVHSRRIILQASKSNRTILAVFLAFFYLQPAYISRIIPYLNQIQAGLMMFALVLIVVKAWKERRVYTSGLAIVLLLCLYFAISTFALGGSMAVAINCLLPVFVFCFYAYTASKGEIIDLFTVLGFGLLPLLFVDIASMVLYPNGLYKTVHVYAVYTQNWFLGYKTARLFFTIPIMAFIAISQYLKHGKPLRSWYIISLFVIVDSWMSDGSIALVGVLFLFAFVVFFQAKSRFLNKTAYVLLSPWITFPLIGISFVFLILLQDSSFFTTVATSLFSKSATFSGRLAVWNACVDSLSQNPVFGFGMIGSEVFEQISHGQVNAHNQLLQVLVNGGVVGAVFYAVSLFFFSVRRKEGFVRYVSVAAVSSMLLAGLFSAVFTFSPVFFMFVVLQGDALLEE